MDYCCFIRACDGAAHYFIKFYSSPHVDWLSCVCVTCVVYCWVSVMCWCVVCWRILCLSIWMCARSRIYVRWVCLVVSGSLRRFGTLIEMADNGIACMYNFVECSQCSLFLFVTPSGYIEVKRVRCTVSPVVYFYF